MRERAKGRTLFDRDPIKKKKITGRGKHKSLPFQDCIQIHIYIFLESLPSRKSVWRKEEENNRFAFHNDRTHLKQKL